MDQAHYENSKNFPLDANPKVVNGIEYHDLLSVCVSKVQYHFSYISNIGSFLLELIELSILFKHSRIMS